MPSRLLRLCTAVLLSLASVRADLASDYSALTTGVTSWPANFNSSAILVYGSNGLPVVKNPGSSRSAAVAAGYLVANGTAGPRAFFIGHDGALNVGSSGNASWQQLLRNVVDWTGGGKGAATKIAYDSSMSTGGTYLRNLGFFTTNPVQVNIGNLPATGYDVYLYRPSSITDSNVTRLQNFVTNGGSLAMELTTWATNGTNVARLNKVLDRFGLYATQDYTDFPTALDPAPTALDNGPGALAVMQDYFDGAPLPSSADQTTARNTLNPINGYGQPADYPVLAAFNAQQEAAAGGQAIITISPSASFNRTTQPPAMDWLVSMQCALLRKWAPADLPQNPGTSGWPGTVAAGEPRVTRTVTINGNASGAAGMGSNAYGINQEQRYVMRPTGLYCPPSNAPTATYTGAGTNVNTNTVTLTFPASLVGSPSAAGIRVQVNHDIENMLGIPNRYDRWPVLDRYYDLNTSATVSGGVATLVIGSANGGLINVTIPPGTNYGNFDVTIANAVECPHFDLGLTSETEWNRLRTTGAPFGYVLLPDDGPETPGFGWLVLVRSKFLADKNYDFIRSVAQYWRRVMNTGDSLMGVKQRGRGESTVSGLNIIAGGGHAGYPIIMDYGDNGLLVDQQMMNGGDWGYYHEFGHTFQDTRNSDYDIATHGEVFVNFLPYLLLHHVHGIRSPDSSGIHDDYDAPTRLTRFNNWLAETAANSSVQWGGGTYGNDAQYELILQYTDAFGWDTFRKGMEVEWDKKTNGASKERFFLMLCNAAQRDLTGLFDRFRITVSAAAKSQVASFAPWSQNQAPVLVLPAGSTVTVDLSQPVQDKVVCDLGVNDPDPANYHRFRIAGGDTDSMFSIDQDTGKLILRRPLARTQASYTLSIAVTDESVPPLGDTQSLTVNFTNTGGLGGLQDKAFTAASTQAVNAVLGSLGGAGVTGWQILSGNADNAIAVNAAGSVTLKTPSALPTRQPRYFQLRASGAGGATTDIRLTLFCNFATGTSVVGATENRWTVTSSATLSNFNYNTTPTTTATRTTLAITSNTADNYIRRLSGYLLVPATGDYTFWLASDDDGQFLLSPDANPANLGRLCTVNGYTDVRAWTSQAGQKSAPVSLRAGQVCYFEARQREYSGGDHLEVAWTGPGIATQTDIGGTNIVRSLNASSSSMILSARPTLPAGHVLANLTTTGTVSNWSIVEGDPDGLFAVNASGVFTLAKPASLSPRFRIYRPLVAARRSDGTTAFFEVQVCSPCRPGMTEELWTGKTGSLVSDFNFAAPPAAANSSQLLSTAERPATGSQYARKISGWFIAPATGRHRFWLTANHPGGAYANSAEFWISPTDQPEEAVRKSWVESPKQNGDFDRSPHQWTDPIELIAGKAYYYEVRQKNGGSSGDHVSLAWTGPASENSFGSTAPGAFRTLLGESNSMSLDDYPAWAERFELAGDNAAATADPDGDGLSNLAEKLLGFSPVDPNSRLRMDLTSIDPSAVHFKVNRTITRGTFKVRIDSDLQPPWDQEITLSVPVDADDILLDYPRASDRCFYQLLYTPPVAP